MNTRISIITRKILYVYPMVSSSTIKRFASFPWIAEVTALLGGFVFLLQAIKYAHMQVSILDESAYM